MEEGSEMRGKKVTLTYVKTIGYNERNSIKENVEIGAKKNEVGFFEVKSTSSLGG